MLNTRMGYVKVRQAVERLEHFDPEDNAQLRSIKTWMWSSVAAGFVLIGICVGCFIAFYAYVHLGWTVLSNQTCIVTCLVLFGLYSSRVVTAVSKIYLDQHKVCGKQQCQTRAARHYTLCLSKTSSFLAHDSIQCSSALYAIARPSVRPSVCLTHGWISQKRLKLELCHFHQRVAPTLVSCGSLHRKIPMGT